MNNNLLNIFTNKDRKRYNQIIQLIEQKKYDALFNEDDGYRFGLFNQKYVDRVLDRMKQEVLDNPDFLITMNQCATYRVDYFNEIAIKSNPKIVEKFIEKDKCSKEDLSIIRTIIEFNETPRNVARVDELFVAMARKNGINDEQMSRVKQMAEVLKDADALDRTRFINKARLNPDFLHYDISKHLIKFASSLQETYAIHDLEEFNCDEAISILLQNSTPQEVLRTIRHSTRGNLKNDDIKSFINSWAASNKQRNDGLRSMLNEAATSKEEDVKHGK